MDMRDRPVAVRRGEELNHAILEAFLQSQFPSFAPPLEISQFPGGYSNLTYQLSWGSVEWVLRRPPKGAQVKTGHDMHREYRILKGLAPIYSKAPRPVIYCEDESILGAPFYIMKRIDGIILRSDQPEAMHPAPDLMRQIANHFIDTLVELHELDFSKAGLATLGKPDGYIERQVTGWNKRYLRAKTDDLPQMESVGTWLINNQPAEGKAALIHNDFKYDNLILDPEDWSNIIGILDWEMATLGDPLMDLGTTLGYWVEADDPPAMKALRLSPTTLPGNPSRAELAEQYCKKSGLSTDNLVFYHVYGLFKIAVIVQQIYYRYKQGHTKDERFAGLIHAVKACSETASQAIHRRRIDRLYS